MNLLCVVAHNDQQRAEAARLRREVYCGEEGLALLPEVPELEKSDSISHLLAYCDGEPVGSLRLVVAAPGKRHGPGRFGLELETCFELSAFEASGMLLAEVTRFCVRRRFRGTRVATALFDLLRLESRRRGVTHWVAAANMETDFQEDAELAYRLIRTRGLVDETWQARGRSAPSAPPLPARPAFTSEQRLRARLGDLGGLRLPRTLSLFATKMGARYIGPPVYEPRFGVFALPLAVDLARLAERTLGSLSLHADTGAGRVANDVLAKDSQILVLPPG
jgi:GNAT superfamily N-acetyltransferase